MIERVVLMILKGIVYTLAIGACIAVIIWACVACGKEDQPMQYEGRMKFAGWSYAESPSKQVGVWIDTETGVCYCGANGKLTMMVDHDGKPFIANGWRDYDGES